MRPYPHEFITGHQKPDVTRQTDTIDEGFLDLSTMSQQVWRDTTPLNYMKGLGARIRKEVGLPVSGGLANSATVDAVRLLGADNKFIFMSPFAFGGRLWMNVADGRHRPASGIRPHRQ